MANDRNSLTINYNRKNRTLKGSFNSVEFINDGYHMIYIPSLNLSSYGHTPDEAEKMMKDIVLKDFCETMLEQPIERVIKELKSLGWDQSPFFKTELSKSAHIDKEGLLRDFDLSEDTQMKERLVTV